MAKETKIGFTLILVLVCAFGFVLYKKLEKDPHLMAEFKARFWPSKSSEEKVITSKPDDKNRESDTLVDGRNTSTDKKQTAAIPISDKNVKTAAAEDFDAMFDEQPSGGTPQSAPQSNSSFDANFDDQFAELDQNKSQQQSQNQKQPKVDQFDDQFLDDQAFGSDPAQPAAAQEEPPFEGDFIQQAEVAQTPQKRVDNSMIKENDSFNESDQFQDVLDNSKTVATKESVASKEIETWDDVVKSPAEIDANTFTTEEQVDPLENWEQPTITSKSDPLDDQTFANENFKEVTATDSRTQIKSTPARSGADDFLDQSTFEPARPIAATKKSVAPKDDFQSGSNFSQTAEESFDQTFADTRPSAGSSKSTGSSQSQLPAGSDSFIDNQQDFRKTAPGIYVVQSGDNYWNISQKIYNSSHYYQALDYYNRTQIPDPLSLQPGMKIRIPSKSTLQSKFPQFFDGRNVAGSTALAQPADKEQFSKDSGYYRNSSGIPYYRVGPRDTLTEIALQHLGRASRWVQVYELNRKQVSDPKALKIGTELQLPADASQVRVVKQATSLR